MTRQSPRLMLTALILAATALVAAGGDDRGTAAPPSSSSGQATSAPTAGASSSGAAVAAAEECREVTHVLGTACVPSEPQRIVALDPSTALPTLVLLDAPVVGAISAFEGSGLPTYLNDDQLPDIEVVGSAYGVNLEAVAALEPDLIVGWENVIAPVQDELEQIAPTVATTFTIYDPDWRAQALAIADLVGGRERIEAELAAIDARVAILREQIVVDGVGLELSRVDSYRDMLIAYRWPCIWLGTELTAVGFQLPAGLEGECTPGDQRSVVVTVSGELLDLIDADAILVYKTNLTGTGSLDPLPDFAANPLWPELRAVQNGTAVAAGDWWANGADVVSLNLVLDDLEELFT